MEGPDFDLWIHIDDIEALNASVAPLGLLPSYTPAEARGRGRYALQNDELVDVLVARSVPTVDGVRVRFDEIWPRRQEVRLTPEAVVLLPCLDDLVATKRFAARPKDLEDIRLLELLRGEPKP